jgi:hypothetical protein
VKAAQEHLTRCKSGASATSSGEAPPTKSKTANRRAQTYP